MQMVVTLVALIAFRLKNFTSLTHRKVIFITDWMAVLYCSYTPLKLVQSCFVVNERKMNKFFPL